MSIGAIKALTSKFKFNKINFNFPRWHSYEHDNWDLLDAILATYVYGSGIKGIWQNSTAYAVNDRLIDDVESKTYLCLVAHTTPATPTTFAQDRINNPLRWRAVTYDPSNRGTWTTATIYSEDEFVVNGTKYCIVAQDHTSGTFSADVAAGKLIVLLDVAPGSLVDFSVTAQKIAYYTVSNDRLAVVPSQTLKGRNNPGTEEVQDLDLPTVRTMLGVNSHGQCQLRYVSANNCTLFPYNGSKLIIDGVPRAVPAAGVTITNVALPGVAALRYVYAYMNAGVMTLELSATAHATHADGVEIMAGNATRTLVGMVYGSTGGGFVDTATARHVASWFNRVARTLATSAGGAVSSTTVVEVNAAQRVSCLCWADEIVDISYNGHAYHSVASGVIYSDIAIDANLNAAFEMIAQNSIVTGFTPIGKSALRVLAEGYHYFNITGRVAAGTATYNGQLTVATKA